MTNTQTQVYTPAPPHHGNLVKFILIGAGVVVLTFILVVIFGGGSSSPSYVNQLKSDGYSVKFQDTLTGGEGVGEAIGTNDSGGAQIVIQVDTAVDAQSLASDLQDTGLPVASTGDLLVITDGNGYNDLVSQLPSNLQP